MKTVPLKNVTQRLKQIIFSRYVLLGVILLILIAFLATLAIRQSIVSQITRNNHFESGTLMYALDTVASYAPEVFSVENPDSMGALGLNKSMHNYSSVRWQLNTYDLVIKAIITQKESDIEVILPVIRYAFDHQLADGSFLIDGSKFNPPETPTPGDNASGTAFYLASLAMSLYLIDSNTRTFNQSDSGIKLIAYIKELKPKINAAIQWLILQSDVLKEYDSKATNRLLYDTLAFYGLGRYLNDTTAIKVAAEFARNAFDMQSEDGGLSENSGFDSSYQAVSIVNLINFYFLIPNGDALMTKVKSVLELALEWEQNKINSSGEIATDNNSRVKPGGESFLGKPKQVAAKSVVMAFGLCGSVFSSTRYFDTSKKVYFYYKDQR